MLWITKFNRALAKAQPKVRDINGGQHREVSVEFAFRHEGRREAYRLDVRRTHPMLSFLRDGYVPVEIILWLKQGEYSAIGVPLPDGAQGLPSLAEKAAQTDDEARAYLASLRQAMKQFEAEMGFALA